jgi:hypothetical protein
VFVCKSVGFLGLGYKPDTNVNNGNILSPLASKAVDVGKGITAKHISAGETHTCAILDNGQLL